ncbi:hypothetical protein ACVPOW_10940 [Staphylococcus aureus]
MEQNVLLQSPKEIFIVQQHIIKGVMNGIHAVVLATGNDTRGAEASATSNTSCGRIFVVLLHGVTIRLLNYLLVD